MTIDKNMGLRYTFVGMLFALAIAQAAILYGDLFKVFTYGWDYHISMYGLIDHIKTENNLMLAPASHLLLGIILVAQSWVGWSKSKSGGNTISVDHIYGFPFILLIIEVILVVMYFILINSVELSLDAFQKTHTLTETIPSPSAAPEATLLFMIFLVYALWDLISDVILGTIPKEHTPIKERPYISKTITFTSGAITCCFVSLISAFIALQIQMKANVATGANSAMWGDFALIALLYFFRTAKWIERLFIKIFPWEGERVGARPVAENAYKSAFAIFTPLAFIYIFLCQM